MDTTDDFCDGRTHDGFNLDPLGHLDAAQSIVTSGNEQTADRNSSIQALDSCDFLERATYSLTPLAAFDTRHHATPPIIHSFQQQHANFAALASASVQSEIAMDTSIVQPYAGLNPAGDELEQYKEEIRDLYADNTLESVRRKINSKYHLKASLKMYKVRIRKWGFNKNLKDVEKAAILRKQIQRSYAGEGSEAQIRNIHNLPSKLKRYRKKMKLRTDQQALALRAPTPPGLIFRSSSPNRPLRMPRELERSELVVRMIQQHVCGMLDSGAWQITKTDVTVTSNNRNPTGEPGHAVLNFEEYCRPAKHDYRRKRSTQAVKWLNIGMSMVEHLLRGQDPLACSTICSVLSQFWNAKDCRPMASTMLKHFAALSPVVLGRGHPFSVLFDSLLHAGGTALGHDLALGVKVAADIFTKKFGKTNRISLDSQAFVSTFIPEVNQRIDVYSCLAVELRDTLGTNSVRYRNTCLDLVDRFLEGGQYQKAAEAAETIVDLTAAANDTKCRALRRLARAQKGLGKTILAERNLRKAIEISAEIRGWENAQTLRYLSSLGDWLDRRGRAEEAASVRTDHENILVTMFDKLHLEEEERFQKYGITDASVS